MGALITRNIKIGRLREAHWNANFMADDMRELPRLPARRHQALFDCPHHVLRPGFATESVAHDIPDNRDEANGKRGDNFL